jgi:hypothetical protein
VVVVAQVRQPLTQMHRQRAQVEMVLTHGQVGHLQHQQALEDITQAVAVDLSKV